MARLVWNTLEKRYYETGLDRGVFYPKVGAAVPWDGLTTVDENGAESAVSYFIDGRPFLYFPKPKEFEATIKAFTYPDEFSEVMGLIEIDNVDGVYVDSQVGTSFDLSYRTKVGNSIEGIDYGYKIHLVYNAVVVPQSVTYETMSSNVNPSEFSWQINATPVLVEGYRPTAHIVIDTRHMDQEAIDKIEEVLYGDSDTAASMPSPEDIVELLTFGEAIIITDNGDGTWSARGSYEKIYMVDGEDGVFQIDDVEHEDFGDGTFSISTTGA